MPETFVLDCSVAAKWILPEPGRPQALELFERYASGEIALVAPDLLLAEFASLLAKRHRRKEIGREQAHAAYRLMTRCAPRLFETRPLLEYAFSLALRHQMSMWNCVYIALAEQHGWIVLTSDLRLFRASGPRHPALRLLKIPPSTALG